MLVLVLLSVATQISWPIPMNSGSSVDINGKEVVEKFTLQDPKRY